MTQQLPQFYYFLGGGRHHSTRAARRMNRFPRRVFRVGEIMVRPGRRTGPVNTQFIVSYFDEIIEKVEKGVLLVQHSADSFVDVDELRAIRAVALGEEPQGPIIKEVAEDESDDDPIDNPDDDFDLVQATDEGSAESAVQAAPDGDPDEEKMGDGPGEYDNMDEPNPAEEAFGEDEPAEFYDEPQDAPESDEGYDEPQDEPEGLQEDEEADYGGGYDDPGFEEPMDAGMEEPFDDSELMETAPKDEPEPTVDLDVEPEPEKRWLPEGYEKLTKKELIALCRERGIQLPKKTNNDTLVALLKEWLQG